MVVLDVIIGIFLGFGAYFVVRTLATGFFAVEQNERAVLTTFGCAEGVGAGTPPLDDPVSESLPPEDQERYVYPLLKVLGPGGPYFKWPWQKATAGAESGATGSFFQESHPPELPPLRS